MSEIQDTTHAGKQTKPAGRDSLWNQCISIAIPRLCQAVGASLSHAAGLLSNLSQTPADQNRHRLIDQTRQMALHDRGSIITAFRLRFVQQLEGKSAAFDLAQGSTSSQLSGRHTAESSSPDLIAQTIRKVCHWELRGIDARFRELAKPENYSGLPNPFSPDLIGQALGAAMEDQGFPVNQRNFLAPMIAEPLAIEVRALYRDLMDLVSGKGLFAIKTQPDDGMGGTGASRSDEISMQYPMPSSNRTTRAASAKTGTLHGVLLALTRLQRGQVELPVTARTEAAPPLSKLAQADFMANTGNTTRVALDMTSAMFEAINSDKGVQAAIKDQIARLQIPVLKAALLDPGMFSDQAHPARKLLHFLVESSTNLGPNDVMALLNAVKMVADNICDHFEENLEIFSTSLHELQQHTTAIRRSQSLAHQEATNAQLNLDDADTSSIRKTIGFHIQDSRLPKFALAFLFDHWETVYRAVYTKPRGTELALAEPSQAMSTLIRTLEPQNWRDSRTAMLSLLPTLLKRLKLGMHAAAISEEAQNSFLAGLAKCHAVVVQATKELPPAVADIAGTATATVAVSQTSAPTAPAEPTSQPEYELKPRADRYDAMVGNLHCGALIEFHEQSGSMAWLKLAWISPNGSIFVFTNKQGVRALTINATALAERLRRDEARVAIEISVGAESTKPPFRRLQNAA